MPEDLSPKNSVKTSVAKICPSDIFSVSQQFQAYNLQAGSQIEIAAAILFMDDSPTIESYSQSFPSWVNIMPLTGFHASFSF